MARSRAADASSESPRMGLIHRPKARRLALVSPMQPGTPTCISRRSRGVGVIENCAEAEVSEWEYR